MVRIPALLIGVLLSGTSPDELRVGDPAPPVVASAWMNLKASAKKPDLEDRVVMVEFWGTWCAPCVRAMPHVQALHDRYGDRGLVVVALSYERPEQMDAFLKKHAYTMPVASDPEKKTVTAYGVSGWPSTFVIDRDGKIAYVGGPYGAEPAIEKALGLEASPGSLLTAYLNELRSDSSDGVRDTLQRLMEKAPPNFALREWAAAMLGQPVPEKPRGRKQAEDLLAELVTACGSGQLEEEQSILSAIAEGPEDCDLHAWAQTQFGEAFPLEQREFKELLKAGRYQVILEAMLYRNPKSSIVAAAAKDKGMRNHCSAKAPEFRKLARKAMLAHHWVFQNRDPRDNDAYWDDLSISGAATSPDKKEIVGILMGGAMLERERALSFIDTNLKLCLLAESLGKGKRLSLKNLARGADKLGKKILSELEGRHG